MRLTRNILAFSCALLLIPAISASAQTSTPDQKPKAAAKAAAKAATHSTSGIVRSVDGGTLVIAKNDKATKTDSFVINATTVKKGDIAVGAKVAVRYTTEGGQNIATAVTVSAKIKGKGRSFPTSSR